MIRFERIEDQTAIFSTQFGTEARLPRQVVPEGSELGSLLSLQLSRGNFEEEEKLRAMRRLLEELIN